MSYSGFKGSYALLYLQHEYVEWLLAAVLPQRRIQDFFEEGVHLSIALLQHQ